MREARFEILGGQFGVTLGRRFEKLVIPKVESENLKTRFAITKNSISQRNKTFFFQSLLESIFDKNFSTKLTLQYFRTVFFNDSIFNKKFSTKLISQFQYCQFIV